MMKKFLGIWFVLLSVLLSACQAFAPSHVTPAPTPQCVEPMLTLGALTFHILPVTRPANSLPEIPKRKKDTAYWVEGTTVNYVFALSPTKDNLALDSAIKAGDPAIIQWADCSKDEYVVKSAETTAALNPSLLDQSSGGITIYVPGDSSTLVIHGERSVVQPAGTAVPVPTNAIQFDLTLLDQSAPNDQTVKIGFTISNSGTKTITLTDKDISLTAGSAAEVFPTGVEPALPLEIPPGSSVSIYATFPKPAASSAVLRVLDVTFDYYFQ